MCCKTSPWYPVHQLQLIMTSPGLQGVPFPRWFPRRLGRPSEMARERSGSGSTSTLKESQVQMPGIVSLELSDVESLNNPSLHAISGEGHLCI